MGRNDDLAETLLHGMPWDQEDLVYRYIWHKRVKEDIRIYLERNPGMCLTESQIDLAAERYVYYGEYDCDATYWNNIEYVIELVKEEEKKNG